MQTRMSYKEITACCQFITGSAVKLRLVICNISPCPEHQSLGLDSNHIRRASGSVIENDGFAVSEECMHDHKKYLDYVDDENKKG